MEPRDIAGGALAAASAGSAVAADWTPFDAAAVDKAFEALATYDWGSDREALNPIDDAVAATSGNAAAGK